MAEGLRGADLRASGARAASILLESIPAAAVVRARHELWWRIRSDPSRHFSFLEIARLFCCDHSSVCHGIHAHERRIQP
jgi:hypothetical protein